MKSYKAKLLTTTVLPIAAVVAGVGLSSAVVSESGLLPEARAACAPANPCNPCAAKACNPCNPCAAKNPCNPCAAAACNPCAIKIKNACNPCAAAACNPCNPCAAKNPCNPCGAAACNPCNPCAAKNPCNPCAAACNPCNPCAAAAGGASACVVPRLAQLALANPCAANPCNPCAAKNPCNPCAAAACNPCNPCGPCGAGAIKVKLTDAESAAAYDCIMNDMATAYSKSGNAMAANYLTWRRYSKTAYQSGTHGGRFTQNYANDKGRAYGAFEDSGPMPAGTQLAKDSFTVNAKGQVGVGPLFTMEKMQAGFNADSGDWRYSMIMPDGSVFGTTGGANAKGVAFCIGCHGIMAEDTDSLYFLPEEYRVN